MAVWFHIDPSSGTPVYRQIVDQVRQAVAGGTLRSGDRLPSVRDLAVELAVNPNTIAKAYQELERDGTITTPRGRGSFVADASVPELSLAERRERLRPAVERLLTEAYHLGVSEGELTELIAEHLARHRSDGGGHRE